MITVIKLDLSNLDDLELIAEGSKIGNATAATPAFNGLSTQLAGFLVLVAMHFRMDASRKFCATRDRLDVLTI